MIDCIDSYIQFCGSHSLIPVQYNIRTSKFGQNMKKCLTIASISKKIVFENPGSIDYSLIDDYHTLYLSIYFKSSAQIYIIQYFKALKKLTLDLWNYNMRKQILNVFPQNRLEELNIQAYIQNQVEYITKLLESCSETLKKLSIFCMEILSANSLSAILSVLNPSMIMSLKIGFYSPVFTN